jgi:HSP20 family protein
MAKSSVKVPVKKAKKAAAKPEPAPTEGAVAHPIHGLRNEIDRVFDRFFHGWPFDTSLTRGLGDPFRDFPTPFRDWPSPFRVTGVAMPRMDVSEGKKSFDITVELPGVEEKDLEVTLTDDLLSVKGEKRTERDEKEKDYHLTERSYGSFQRSFHLPPDVDVGKVKAEFVKGVLSITIPKSTKAKPKQRKVPIKSG